MDSSLKMPDSKLSSSKKGEKPMLNEDIKPHHLRQLELSAITYANHLGLESTKEGLKFQYLNLKTKGFFKSFDRVRYDRTKGGQKYTQPAGSGVKLYFPPTYALSMDEQMKNYWWSALEDTELKPRTVVIVEGEKKALSLQSAIGPRCIVIGLGGVWNWGIKADDGDRKLIKDFQFVKRWKDRSVYICFDSDVESNPKVEKAEYMLQRQLREELGVRAKLITLTPEQEGDKVGIDDLIYSCGSSFGYTWRDLKFKAIKGQRYRLPTPITGGTLVTTNWPKSGVILSDGDYGNLLVEGGSAFVHAGSGVGKTYFLLQLSACLTAGKEFLGFQPDKHRKVLFLQQELSEGWFSHRVKRLKKAFGPYVDDICFVNGDFQLASIDKYKNASLYLERLQRLINRNDPDLVVLDPLQGYYDLAESSVDHSREFMKAIVSVSKSTGCCIVMSHHDRKDATGSSMSQMRGGSPFSDLSDTVIGIKRLPDFETNEKGHKVKRKDEFGEVIYHPTDLVVNFDKVRHNDGPLPPRMPITRMNPFEDGSFNPFFVPLNKSLAVKEVTIGGFQHEY